MDIIALLNGFFMIKLQQEEDMQKVLRGGSWMLGKREFILKK